MNKVVVSLEGLPGSGKTSLLHGLSNEELEILPEIMDYVPETGKVKKFTIERNSSTRTNEWFLNIEIERLNKAMNATKSVIMDRCFVSQIAYNYAKDRTYKTKNIPILRNLIGKYKIIMPNIIYLKIDTFQSVKRMLIRNKNFQKEYILSGEPDYHYDFLENNRLFYEKIIPLLDHNVLILDGDGNLSAQIELIKKWVTKLDPFILNFNIDDLFLNL